MAARYDHALCIHTLIKVLHTLRVDTWLFINGVLPIQGNANIPVWLNKTRLLVVLLRDLLVAYVEQRNGRQQKPPSVGVRGVFGQDVRTRLLCVDVLDIDAAIVLYGAVRLYEIDPARVGYVAHRCGSSFQHKIDGNSVIFANCQHHFRVAL